MFEEFEQLDFDLIRLASRHHLPANSQMDIQMKVSQSVSGLVKTPGAGWNLFTTL